MYDDKKLSESINKINDMQMQWAKTTFNPEWFLRTVCKSIYAVSTELFGAIYIYIYTHIGITIITTTT